MNKRERLEKGFQREDDELCKQFILAALEHRAGRKFMWRLLQIGKAIGHDPFANNALVMANETGQVKVGLQILEMMIGTAPDAFPRLMTEMENERLERERQLADADGGSDDFGGDFGED